jgi:hypothetical protein
MTLAMQQCISQNDRRHHEQRRKLLDTWSGDAEDLSR